MTDHAHKPTVSQAEAEAAVRTLIQWAGDNPDREGLKDTPRRVVDAYSEWFDGYDADAGKELSRTFEDVTGYDDMVILRDIEVESHCEHHLAPFLGKAYVAYLPGEKVVGISKLARLVDAYGRRLQIQERLTAEIADTLQRVLQPRGVAVVIQASHECISSRGARMHGVSMVTRRLLGQCEQEPYRRDILAALAG